MTINKNAQRIEKIQALLSESLSIREMNVIDESHLHAGHAGNTSGAGHFVLNIAADELDSLSRIESHRLIYHIVSSMMPEDIHALNIHII